MSLYDKYHSDINMNYMYDLISQIINKDTGEDISNNGEFKKIFSDNAKQIFNEVNSDVLEEINKVLLDKHILQFTNLIQLKKPPPQQLDENVNMTDRYNDLIQSRNIPLMEPKDNSDKSLNNEAPLNNGNPFLSLQQTNPDNVNVNPVEKLPIIEEESPVSELIEDIHSTPKSIDSIPEPIKYPQYKVISSKRSNIQSSRFHYIYNLLKNNIKSSELKHVSKIVIPVEENYIFSSPILFLQIKELNFSSSFELDHIIDDDKKKY